ncbi:MAG: hypothetical protein HYY29_02930, partial [Chloroflexi bacterium]|nr:hypothetical protein [Chloroflexota bacterium]
ITRRSQHIMIAVAGGDQSLQSHLLGVGFGPARPASATIELPAWWDQLLQQAETDLGPASTP